MFTLYKFELKKIFAQKYFLLASLVMCLFLVAVGVTPMFLNSIPTKQEKEIISNRLIDDELINEAKENNGNGLYSYIVDFVRYCTNNNDIKNYTAQDVYDERLKTIEKEKANSYINDKEYDYWLTKQKQIKTPFIYYADTGYVEVYELVSMISFLIIVLINIAVSGIFADESQTGADQILLSSKKGKTSLFTAKILASMSVGVMIPLILFFLILTLDLTVFGKNGYNTPIQVHIPTCLYDLTIGKSLYYCLSKLVISGILCSCFSAFLSQLTRKHQSSQAISIVIMLISMVSIPEKFGLISYIWHFLPATNIGTWMFNEYRMINLFGVMLNDFASTALVWCVVSVILVIFTKISYKKQDFIAK